MNASVASDAVSVGEMSLLIADENEAFRDFMAEQLSGPHIRVLTASTGPQALKLAAESHPGIVLLDALLPGMDGYEVCKALREDERMRHAVILMTAQAKSADRLRGFACGANDYVTKPVDSLWLTERMRRCRDHLQAQAPPPPRRKPKSMLQLPRIGQVFLREKLSLDLEHEAPTLALVFALFLLPCIAMEITSVRSKLLARFDSQGSADSDLVNPALTLTAAEAALELVPGKLTLGKLNALLGSDRFFANAFREKPGLRDAWKRFRKDKDSAALQRVLRHSTEFNALIARFLQDEPFQARLGRLALEQASRDAVSSASPFHGTPRAAGPFGSAGAGVAPGSSGLAESGSRSGSSLAPAASSLMPILDGPPSRGIEGGIEGGNGDGADANANALSNAVPVCQATPTSGSARYRNLPLCERLRGGNRATPENPVIPGGIEPTSGGSGGGDFMNSHGGDAGTDADGDGDGGD